MTVEEINKTNDNPRQKRVMSFLDLIEANGYIINDFGKMTEITEAVANGNTSVIDKLNSLQKLEEDLTWGENSTNVFRENMKASLDGLANIVNNHISVKETDDKGKDFNDKVRELKFKLGIIQDFDRVQKAVESRNNTKKLIDGLGSRADLTQEQKMAEYRRLMFIYNGPNLAAIETAKRISTSNEKAVAGKMFDMSFINEIVQDLKAISDVAYSMNFSEIKNADGSLVQSSDDVRKELIDQFRNITTTVNEYRIDIVKYNSAKNTYDTVLKDLGIERNFGAKKGKSKPIEPVTKADPVVEEPTSTPEIETEKKPEEIIPAPETPVEVPPVIEETPEAEETIETPATDSSANHEAEVYEEPLLVTWNGSNEVAIPGVGEPNGLLEEGKTYEVESSEIMHGMTYFKIKGLPGMFDGGIFNTLNMKLDESSPELDPVNPEEMETDEEIVQEETEKKPKKSRRGRKATKYNEDASHITDKLAEDAKGVVTGKTIARGIALTSLVTSAALSASAIAMFPVTMTIGGIWIAAELIGKAKSISLAKKMKRTFKQMRIESLQKKLNKYNEEEQQEVYEALDAAEEMATRVETETLTEAEELKEGFGK